jgi:hypothetical protein
MTTLINADVLLEGIRQLGWRTDTHAELERMAADIALLLSLDRAEGAKQYAFQAEEGLT